MAEDLLKMEEMDNANMNFNYLNHFQELCIKKFESMKQFYKKCIIIECWLYIQKYERRCIKYIQQKRAKR
jgi:hypothetical protein